MDGQIVIRNGNRFDPTALSATGALRVRGLMQVRDAVREVLRTQLDDEPEEQITAARQHLNRVYDRFVSRHGPITAPENYRAFHRRPRSSPAAFPGKLRRGQENRYQDGHIYTADIAALPASIACGDSGGSPGRLAQ